MFRRTVSCSGPASLSFRSALSRALARARARERATRPGRGGLRQQRSRAHPCGCGWRPHRMALSVSSHSADSRSASARHLSCSAMAAWCAARALKRATAPCRTALRRSARGSGPVASKSRSPRRFQRTSASSLVRLLVVLPHAVVGGLAQRRTRHEGRRPRARPRRRRCTVWTMTSRLMASAARSSGRQAAARARPLELSSFPPAHARLPAEQGAMQQRWTVDVQTIHCTE